MVQDMPAFSTLGNLEILHMHNGDLDTHGEVCSRSHTDTSHGPVTGCRGHTDHGPITGGRRPSLTWPAMACLPSVYRAGRGLVV